MLGVIPDNVVMSVSGDIHINLRGSTDKEWEVNRVLQLFQTLAEDNSSIVVLSGDIFDKANATLEEIGLFYEGLSFLEGKEVYVIEGNHEEINDNTTTFNLLPHSGYTLTKVGFLEHRSTYVWLVGHPQIQALTKDSFPILKDKNNILISHYRSDIGIAKEEVDNSIISEKFTTTILSDIHYRLVPAENIRYTSSPYGIHYTPMKDYGYTQVIFTEDGYSIEDITLDLPSKVKVTTTVEGLEACLKTLQDKHLYNIEITGESSPELLALLAKHENIGKFSFEGFTDSVDDIPEELLINVGNSVEGLLVVALGDLELTPEELERAKEIIKEEV